MKRFLLLLAAVVFTNILFAQNEQDETAQEEREISIPDYSSIQKIISDSNSLFFYPRLYKKYTDNDTNLSLREYRMLYYGYFFQDGYLLKGNMQRDDSIKSIFNKENLSQNDWQAIIILEKRSLQTTPFELKKLNILYLAYKKIGNGALAAVYLDKIKKIAFTILSSGDGQTEQTGLHVLEISDEYAMVSILGYEYGGQQQLTPGTCDYLSLKENGDNIKGLYFDVKQIFKGYQKLYGNNDHSEDK